VYVLTDDAPAKPKLSATSPTGTGGPATPVGTWHVTRGPSVFVGYRIKELFGDAVLKRDAVGRTGAVNGSLAIAANRVTTAVVSADVTKIDSGRGARATRTPATTRCRPARQDGTLHTHVAGRAPAHLAKGQKVHSVAQGKLLLHGVTRPVTITLDARWNGPTIDAVGTLRSRSPTSASTRRTRRSRRFDDHGSLEFDLTFAPGARASAG